MRAHAWCEKGDRSVFSEPISGRPGDSNDVIDAAAACRDGYFSLGRGQSEGVQFPVNLRLQIG
ncbi:MAG: hypothetical protein CMP27_05040 [Roseibacillus sp.]|nr:hypothetical protein [Roseibacillus sp.]